MNKTLVDQAFETRDIAALNRILQEERTNLERCMVREGIVLSAELRTAKMNTGEAERNVSYVRARISELVGNQ